MLDRIVVQVLIAELVDEHDASADERLAGVQVADHLRQEVQDLPPNITPGGQELSASRQQHRRLARLSEHQTSAFELLDLEVHGLAGQFELGGQGNDIQLLLAGLGHADGLKDPDVDFLVVVAHS